MDLSFLKMYCYLFNASKVAGRHMNIRLTAKDIGAKKFRKKRVCLRSNRLEIKLVDASCVQMLFIQFSKLCCEEFHVRRLHSYIHIKTAKNRT